MGTRDETLETSGSLLSIKNTYYKTVLNTNETVYIIFILGQLLHGLNGWRKILNGLWLRKKLL